MSKIIGDDAAIQRIENARPGDPTVYVNMDAIRQLPDTYEARITTVPFDAAKDFDDIGNGNFMPTPNLMNSIATARGIEGTDDVSSEPIKMEINVNPMLMKGLEEEPTMRTMVIGHRSTKKGFVIQEDGEGHYSDPCVVDYNVFDRCVALWMKEEAETNGYDPAIVKNGPYSAFNKQYNGPHYFKGQYAYGLKYATKHLRQLHFAEEMKFAQRKADTKSRHIVIRVLAGLKTGYKKSDLSDGSFCFSSIKLSGDTVKLREAARVEALRRGLGDGGAGATVDLFGQQALPETTIEPSDDDILGDFPDIPQESIKPEWEKAKDTLSQYLADGVVKDIPLTEQMIGWLIANEDKCLTHQSWPKVLNQIKAIEAEIGDGDRVDHSLPIY